MQSPKSALRLLLKFNLSSNKKFSCSFAESRLNSQCRSSLKYSVVFCPLADRSSGRGRSRGQGHHQMRDLSTPYAPPSPHDTHATCFISQRRTVRASRNQKRTVQPICSCLFICACPQPDNCIRDRGSEQRSQQSGLPPQTAKEERNQVLHRPIVRKEREGQAGAAGKRTCRAWTRYRMLKYFSPSPYYSTFVLTNGRTR